MHSGAGAAEWVPRPEGRQATSICIWQHVLEDPLFQPSSVRSRALCFQFLQHPGRRRPRVQDASPVRSQSQFSKIADRTAARTDHSLPCVSHPSEARSSSFVQSRFQTITNHPPLDIAISISIAADRCSLCYLFTTLAAVGFSMGGIAPVQVKTWEKKTIVELVSFLPRALPANFLRGIAVGTPRLPHRCSLSHWKPLVTARYSLCPHSDLQLC